MKERVRSILRKRYFYQIAIAILIIILGIYLNGHRDWVKNLYPPKKIHVKVVGEIQNPGVYELEENEKIQDLIRKAGVLKSSSVEDISDTELFDGQIVNIGKKEI